MPKVESRTNKSGRVGVDMSKASAGWLASQKRPRVLKEDGSRICLDGMPVSECRYDHSRCRDCVREFSDCVCYLDSERVEWMRSQMRVVRGGS